MRFSVIIPTYNRLPLLKQAIQSVLAQTMKNYELIVVDDGSTDGTIEYLDALSNVTVTKQANQGPAAARNAGAKVAKGDYLAFLDSDDLWFPWALATFNFTIEYFWPAVISAALLEFSGEPPAYEREFRTPFVEPFDNFFATARRPMNIPAAGMVVHRATFISAGGFDETMRVAEDSDLYLRLGAYHKYARIRAPYTTAYRIHSGNTWINAKANARGLMQLLEHERKGRYPLGKEYRRERYKLISRSVRPAALACLQNNMRAEAWDLFRRSFWMNLRLMRLRFLAGFVVRSVSPTR